MEFWLIKEGEKEGPFLDFDLRSRIRSGEVSPDQRVWYSDLEGWTPLEEVELFANEFREIQEVTEDNVDHYLRHLDEEFGESATTGEGTPPMLPVQIHLWRRFGARWFDYVAYLALFFSWVALAEIDLKGLQGNLLFPFVMMLPWIFAESAAVHFWGTTPGKWLTGLRVRSATGHKLSAIDSTLRAMRVMVLGMGFGQPVLRELCHIISLWLATKKKVVMWDTATGVRLEREGSGESIAKWIAFGIGLFTFLLILMTATYQIGRSQMSDEEFAKLEERVEKVLGPQRPKR